MSQHHTVERVTARIIELSRVPRADYLALKAAARESGPARMRLEPLGLATHSAFGFLLPKAFVFGVRWRVNEQNPSIVATVQNLVKKLSPLAPGA